MAIDERDARQLLEEERRRLERVRSTVEGDLEEERLGTSEELTSYDQHPAERGTELSDMERDLGLRDDFEERIEENQEAWKRLEEGRYGRCERCGRPIGDERLRAMPSTRYCVEHQVQEDSR